MTLVYRTTGAWGAGKGTNLTPVEADGNIYDLAQQIAAIIADPPQPNEIAAIDVTDDQMTIIMDDSTEFGPFTLPLAELKWEDAWLPSTAYKRGNLLTATVSELEGVYLVNQDHTSAAGTFDPDAGNLSGPYYTFLFPSPNRFAVGGGFFFAGPPGFGLVDGSSDFPSDSESEGGIRPMFAYRAVSPFYLLTSLPGSLGGYRIGMTGTASYPIFKGSVQIGEVIGDADSEDDISFVFADDVQFMPGDVLYIGTPDMIDATARDLTLTLYAYAGILEVESESA